MVKPAEVRDLEVLANLAVLLWENHSAEDLLYEFTKIMSHGEAQFFMKYVKDVPVGFAQCQLRHACVEGTETTPVGYLEGIFVKEGYRNQGYAKETAGCLRSMGKTKWLP